MQMSKQNIDGIFADHTDSEICSAWDHALCDILELQGEHVLDDWPDSWRIAWVVTTYLGLWEGDGIGALWEANREHVELFSDSLKKLGSEHTATFVIRSLDFAKKDGNGREGEDILNLAAEWDQSLSFYTDGVTEKLASYLRAHRQDAEPLLSIMVNRPKS
jgi:hypothetical protein